ncbi:DUF309 domain-containing protein [Cetobacterium somerae]|uniref:DUF309 domain-containing protein n=1 Tax=Cetobacterium sp. NK01 TaxID=2993530 RepID=UPI0021161614|nr:DUF309 domain-containing protein [Cetobacterium sp. NK01]MCQ8211327.1 DUF309 domain-containing protein [Cetobacterium sp. NK01]
MRNKERYYEFIDVFQNQRDFFKCHEILEEVWIEETRCKTRNHVSINLLLIAVGLYHWKNKNIKGAIQVLENSLNNYDNVSLELEKLNIDSKELKKIIQLKLSELRNGKEYQDVYLPRY